MLRPASIALLCLAAAACSSPLDEIRDQDVEFAVRNNEHLDEDELLAAALPELRSFVTHGLHAWDVSDAAYAMERRMREEGFPRVQVDFRMEPDEENVRRVVFRIQEGPRAFLGDVSFEGVERIDREKLQELFVFEGSGLLGTGQALFRENQVESAVSEVESLYLLNGFLRVEVGPYRITWNEEHTEADVVVPVKEGRQYLVKEVRVEVSGGPVEAAELERRVAGLEGRPYHARVPSEAAAAIVSFLGDRGRLRARVDQVVDVNHEHARATITLKVHPGPRLELRELTVEGLETTSEDFVRDRLDLGRGVILTRSELDRAVSDLYRTGIFSFVRARESVVEGAGGEDPVPADVVVEVEELDARSLDVELGWGSYELLRGGVRYRDRNLFGAGRDLEVGPFASLRSVDLQTRFLDPYILGDDNTLELSGGFEYRQQPSFEETAGRAEAAVRHMLDPRTSLRGGYRLRVSSASNVDAALEEEDVRGETTTTSGPFLNIQYDGRDNALVPRKGLLVDASAYWSTPAMAADLDFLELRAKLAAHHELGEGTWLAWGFQASTKEILDGRETLPIQERFFLGGESSVRSFNESELGPVDADGDPTGGLTAFEAHVELRQRLVEKLEAAFFYDLGTVGEDSYDANGPYGHAVGVGLRYVLPVGPVRLDFGWNPGRTFAADKHWALHFSFGFSF